MDDAVRYVNSFGLVGMISPDTLHATLSDGCLVAAIIHRHFPDRIEMARLLNPATTVHTRMQNWDLISGIYATKIFTFFSVRVGFCRVWLVKIIFMKILYFFMTKSGRVAANSNSLLQNVFRCRLIRLSYWIWPRPTPILTRSSSSSSDYATISAMSSARPRPSSSLRWSWRRTPPNHTEANRPRRPPTRSKAQPSPAILLRSLRMRLTPAKALSNTWMRNPTLWPPCWSSFTLSELLIRYGCVLAPRPRAPCPLGFPRLTYRSKTCRRVHLIIF